MMKFKQIFLLAISLIFMQNTVFAIPEIYSEQRVDGNYTGIRNENGKVIVKPLYKEIEKRKDGYILTPHPKYKVVYNLKGDKILALKESYIINYFDNYLILQNNNGYFIANMLSENLNGKYYKYMIPKTVDNNFVLAYTNEKDFEILNSKGKEILSSKDIKTHAFPGNGIVIYKNTEDKFFLINSKGEKREILENKFKELSEASQKLEENNHYYMAFSENIDGKIRYGITNGYDNVIEPKYDEVSVATYDHKYFGYKANDLWGVKDFSENTILGPQFKSPVLITGDKIFERATPDYIFMDEYFNKLFSYSDMKLVGDFHSGLAIASKVIDGSLKYGYINKSGRVVVDFKYDAANDFSENLAVVAKIIDGQKKYGYIDRDGKLVIDFNYDYAFRFEDGVARVRIDKEQFYINDTGKILRKVKANR